MKKQNTSKALSVKTFKPRTGMALLLYATVGSTMIHIGNASAQDQGLLEEVVVTANKRTETLQEVPMSISVVGRDELLDRGITDLQEIQYAVPSLLFSEYLGQANISIRGVGDFLGNPGVSVSVDGIYQATSVTAKLAQLDLERVEVLRGPQGTLHGRNSNGGVVNFISRMPSEDLEGYARLGYAEYQETNIAAAVGGPITDAIGYRLSIDHTTSDEGWVDNLAPGFDDLMYGDQTGYRARLVADLSDSATLDLLYAGAKDDGPLYHTAFFSDQREVTDPRIQELTITLEPRETYQPKKIDVDREYNMYGASLNWDLGPVTLDSITGYQTYEEDFSLDGGAYDVLFFDLNPDKSNTDTFTQELRFSGNTDSIDWLVGLFYMDIEFNKLTNFIFPQGFDQLPPESVINFDNFKINTESSAAFFDVAWSATDRSKLSFGARLTRDEINSDVLHTITIPPDFVITDCEGERNAKDDSTTVRGVYDYSLTESGTVYASYSEGFKAGGVALFECSDPYEPEKIAAYEIGTKWTLWDGRTTLNAAAFYYDYQDFQVTQVVGLSTVTRNVGDASILGGELELRSIINNNWSIDAQLTLLDSEYDDFVNVDVFNQQLGEQQLEGNTLNRTPETSLNFGVEYTLDFDTAGSLSFRVDAAYRSRIYFREFNEKEDSQESYTLANLNINWKSPEGTWAGRLYANNFTDEEYAQELSGDGTAGGHLGQWGTPRQIGASITRFF
ncbi:MAG: TonB-dependent receptor [Pseudomonadota bacterium]